MRPVSDRPASPAPAGLRPARPVTPYGARAYGAAARIGTERGAGHPGRTSHPAPRRQADPAADAGRALLAARPAPPGVETEVSLRLFADGGSIAVVRHLRDGATVGIEAMIR